MNISSIIVIPHPDHIAAVRDRLQVLPGVELHAVSPEGRMIATLEAESDRETVELFERISLLEGVMSASMVYHQKENDPDAPVSVEASPARDATALA
ncbi:MAG: chaperone NapD [Rhodocyclaceae bacterium]